MGNLPYPLLGNDDGIYIEREIVALYGGLSSFQLATDNDYDAFFADEHVADCQRAYNKQCQIARINLDILYGQSNSP